MKEMRSVRIGKNKTIVLWSKDDETKLTAKAIVGAIAAVNIAYYGYCATWYFNAFKGLVTRH